MAHIAVQLQRTPSGLHPASAVALCWARDIASARGATVTALCVGDAGKADEAVIAGAGRFGADIVLFGGPSGLANLCERLNPVHVLVPHTPDGLQAVNALGRGPATARWIDRRSPPYATADAVTAVVAGVRPWHWFDLELDPEYEGDVDTAELPGFLQGEDPPAPPLFDLGRRPLGYVAADDLDPMVVSALRELGAEPTSWADAPHRNGGTTLVLGTEQFPPVDEDEEDRDDHGRVVGLAGTEAAAAQVPEAWRAFDWVLPGRWSDVITTLTEGPWTKTPT